MIFLLPPLREVRRAIWTRRVAFALVLVAAPSVSLSAQTGAVVPIGPDGSVDAHLTAIVSQQWDVDPEYVRLEWVDGVLGASPDSVLVRGGASESWIVTAWLGDALVRRFVRAGVESTVPVAGSDLVRGTVLSEEHVAWQPRVTWGRPSVAASDPIGLETQRRIARGEELAAPSVRPPLLVRGGDPVEAVLKHRGLLMTVRGEALASARMGDRLFVRLESGKRVSAFAVGDGLVELIAGGK